MEGSGKTNMKSEERKIDLVKALILPIMSSPKSLIFQAFL